VTTFGETLRTFRERTLDPVGHMRPLSQARLGVLMGHVMGDKGVRGATVSHWERGETKISAEDRKILITLVKVLHQYDGVKTPEDANQLLEAGNFRALNKHETHEIFGELPIAANAETHALDQESSKSFASFLREQFFSSWNALLEETRKGPHPSWPRVMAALMRKTSDLISFSPKTVLWIGVWWLAWWLMAPSLRWPFADRASALQAVGMYVIGTLIVPLLMGMLIDTKHDEYWRAQDLAHSRLLRLYTYQGAGIGFNLGYFFVLPLVLIWYYLGLEPSRWLESLAITLGLILGNMSAHVVPHNLWLAYRRLLFKDGAIFFVVAFVGPLWGIFFLEYYSVLLKPFWGAMVILAALLLFIMIPFGQSKKKTDTKQAQP
jgi:hypothetical protein